MEKRQNANKDQSLNENESAERLQDTIGAGRADQDANADRGGTADLSGTVRRTSSNSTGSGMHSKSGVSGSDLDGQVADQ